MRNPARHSWCKDARRIFDATICCNHQCCRYFSGWLGHCLETLRLGGDGQQDRRHAAFCQYRPHRKTSCAHFLSAAYWSHACLCVRPLLWVPDVDRDTPFFQCRVVLTPSDTVCEVSVCICLSLSVCLSLAVFLFFCLSVFLSFLLLSALVDALLVALHHVIRVSTA